MQPEGSPKETNTPILIDLKQQPSFSTSVKVAFPPHTVRGSERVRVTAIGMIYRTVNSEILAIFFLENKVKRHMSHDLGFPTMWYVRPEKPQINLHMRAV